MDPPPDSPRNSFLASSYQPWDRPRAKVAPYDSIIFNDSIDRTDRSNGTDRTQPGSNQPLLGSYVASPNPLADAYLTSSGHRFSGQDDSDYTVTGEDYPIGLSQSILLSSTASVRLPDIRASRANLQQWTWLQYLCWVVPTLYCSVIYFIQLLYGLTLLRQSYNVAVYNLGAGLIGLVITLCRVYDVWIFIKPTTWLTPDNIAELTGQKSRSACWDFTLFSFLFLLDTLLFAWTTLGSIYTLVLYGSDLEFPELMLVFAIINLIWHWSKFGLLVFSVKAILRWRSVELLRLAGAVRV